MHIGEPVKSALELVGQPREIDAEAVQHRGVQIVQMCRITHEVVPEVVRFAVRDSRLDAAARHPDGEAARMVIAAVILLRELPLAEVVFRIRQSLQYQDSFGTVYRTSNSGVSIFAPF
jgi:hypothetical protein